MSGIYLVVWDNKNKHNTPLLKPTKGGWPHMTLAYTGKHLSREQLVGVAADVFPHWAGKLLTLCRAYVNSFEDRPGHTRHDVLLEVEEVDEVEESRTWSLRSSFRNYLAFSMNDPHVTHGVYETLEEAKEVAGKLSEMLPYQVEVTGVTID